VSNLSSRLARQRQIAQHLWQSYLQAGDFFQFDRWLATEFKKHGRFGKRDRALYREWLFTALRFGTLAATLMEYGERPDAKPLAQYLDELARQPTDPHRIAAQWRTLDADLFFTLIETRYHHGREEEALLPLPEPLPEPLAAQYQALARLAEHELPALLLWQGIPLDYLAPLQARAALIDWDKPTLCRWVAQQSLRPPVWVRINHPERRAEVLAELENLIIGEEGDALALSVQGSLNNFRCFQQGWLEVQDLASQQLGGAVLCQPGDTVWDACAGAGGKTLQLLSRLQHQGLVVASDIRSHKLKELQKRSRQAGFHNLQPLHWDGKALPALPEEVRQRGGFDWVLVDAPCSSSGTWRRNPEVRHRELGTDLKQLTALQQQLLHQAAQGVKPGGYLVYGTCSFRTEENEAVVQTLLDQGGWTLELQQMVGCPEQDADTMFVARLRADH